MRAALRGIAQMAIPGSSELTFRWESLDFAHTTAIRARLAERYAPATGNRILAALRGTLKTAFKLGLMSSEQMTRACMVEPVRGLRVATGRSIAQGELRALFGECDPKKPVGARDAALLGLLYGAGLRRSEVVGLDLASYDPITGVLVIRGKGNKERRVPLPNGSRAALTAWIGHRGDDPGPLLFPVRKGGLIQNRRMIDQSVADRLRLLLRNAKVAGLSAHDFRRTFVGDLLDAGADLATVQGMAGHASPATTSRYDRRGDRARQRAASLLHIPFRGDD